MRGTPRRVFALLLILGWMLPGFGALSVGLHLAIDHHHAPKPNHPCDLSDLVRAVEHGHRHDGEAVPDHRHEARSGSAPAIPSSVKIAAVLPAVESTEVGAGEATPPVVSERRGPPAALFASNCCLLL